MSDPAVEKSRTLFRSLRRHDRRAFLAGLRQEATTKRAKHRVWLSWQDAKASRHARAARKALRPAA